MRVVGGDYKQNIWHLFSFCVITIIIRNTKMGRGLWDDQTELTWSINFSLQLLVSGVPAAQLHPSFSRASVVLLMPLTHNWRSRVGEGLSGITLSACYYTRWWFLTTTTTLTAICKAPPPRTPSDSECISLTRLVGEFSNTNQPVIIT